jgi:hypothetical protein
VSINELKNYLQIGCQFAISQGGKFLDHSVKVLHRTAVQVTQSERLAGALVLIANPLFLELTLYLTCKIEEKLCPQVNEQEEVKLSHSFIVLTMASSLMVGMNMLLCRGVRLPLSSWAIAVMSVTACVCYTLFHLCIAKEVGSH